MLCFLRRLCFEVTFVTVRSSRPVLGRTSNCEKGLFNLPGLGIFGGHFLWGLALTNLADYRLIWPNSSTEAESPHAGDEVAMFPPRGQVRVGEGLYLSFRIRTSFSSGMIRCKSGA